MSEMTLYKPVAVLTVIALYLALTIIGYLYFAWARDSFASTASSKVLLALAGPTLSLRTHMSYILYGAQSVLLIPLIAIGVMSSRFRSYAWTALAIVWLMIGWRMYAMF